MELDQASRPKSCHLDGSPKGLVWRPLFPLGFPRFFHLEFGGSHTCVFVHTHLSVLCMCLPTTLPCALCIFRRGTLCDISIPTTSQGSCDLRPASSQQCISLHPPLSPPSSFLLPFLPPPLSPSCGLQHCIN